MRDTKQEIVDLADQFIRTRGFNAFSYADISKLLQVKNAAIHYHFPSKFDLGLTVIQQTIVSFQDLTASWSELEYTMQLEEFIKIYDRSKAKNCVCLMGALAPSYDTLSAEMQQALTVLGQTIIAWLSDLLEEGRENEVFNFKGSSRAQAFLIQSALLASLILEKVLQENVCQTIREVVLKQ